MNSKNIFKKMKKQKISRNYFLNLQKLPKDLLLEIKNYLFLYSCHGCLKTSYFPIISQGKFHYCSGECYNFF